MAVELAHTSATAGVDPGTSGFTTVLRTSGMSGETRRALENLSAYKADGDPPMPVYGHRMVRVAARPIHVLSSIVPHGTDQSGRANRLAWHLAFESTEIGSVPLIDALDWLLQRSATWDEVARIEADGPMIEDSSPATNGQNTTLTWSSWGCDPEWAHVLASIACRGEPTAVIVPDQANLQQVVRSVLCALDATNSWTATICAGTLGLDRDTNLRVVVVHEGTQAAQRLRAGVARQVIELPDAVLPKRPEPTQANPNSIPAGGASSGRSLRETHAYLFDEKTAETTPPPPELPIRNPTRRPHPLESSTNVSKQLIILVIIGIIALLGLIAIMLF